MNFAVELVIVLALILINGLLAMIEIAIVSARRARLIGKARDGDVQARAALELAENPADFLSTVQIGITLVGVLVGAFSGATLAEPLAGTLNRIPGMAPYSYGLALGGVVLAITYLSLILGELAPKRIGLAYPETIARWTARPMQSTASVFRPVVRFLSFSSEVVLRAAGIRPSVETPVTTDEIEILMGQGASAGVIEPSEREMVSGVFRLGDLKVNALMVPRPDIIWLDLDDPPDVTREKIIHGAHPRYPVARGDLDNIAGVVKTKELLVRRLTGQELALEAMLEPPWFVPESMPALKVLEQFKENRSHMALVVDEFGGIQGLVTLNDLLEAIVGDEIFAGDEDPDFIRREDGSFLVDGSLAIPAMREKLGAAVPDGGRFPLLPNEGRGHYQTIGGFFLDHLGRIPRAGDHFILSGVRFEVMDMDGLRVDKVLISFPGSKP
jgi:putative hemolysin